MFESMKDRIVEGVLNSLLNMILALPWGYIFGAVALFVTTLLALSAGLGWFRRAIPALMILSCVAMGGMWWTWPRTKEVKVVVYEPSPPAPAPFITGDTASNVASGVGDGVGKVAEGVGDGVGKAAEGIGKGIGALVESIGEAGGKVLSPGSPGNVPTMPDPTSMQEHDARIRIARDELARAEQMVTNAREMLVNARGLQQHQFWNAKIDEFQLKVVQKRSACDAAIAAMDALIARQEQARKAQAEAKRMEAEAEAALEKSRVEAEYRRKLAAERAAMPEHERIDEELTRVVKALMELEDGLPAAENRYQNANGSWKYTPGEIEEFKQLVQRRKAMIKEARRKIDDLEDAKKTAIKRFELDKQKAVLERSEGVLSGRVLPEEKRAPSGSGRIPLSSSPNAKLFERHGGSRQTPATGKSSGKAILTKPGRDESLFKKLFGNEWRKPEGGN